MAIPATTQAFIDNMPISDFETYINTEFYNSFNGMEFPNISVKMAYIYILDTFRLSNRQIQDALDNIKNKPDKIEKHPLTGNFTTSHLMYKYDYDFQIKFLAKYEKMLEHLEKLIYAYRLKQEKNRALGIVAN
jgi:hypothetical protein